MSQLDRGAEEALRESREHYRQIVENANSVILRWDLQGRIQFMNVYGCALFGYSLDELVGRSIRETIVPRDARDGRDLEAMIQGIINEPVRYTLNENENVCKDGRRVIINWTNTAIRAASGECQGILSIGNDVTERRRAEEQLRRRTEMLGAIATIHSRFLLSADVHTVFDGLLATLLSVTESEYGFIGEVLHSPEGKPYLKTYALTNIAWDEPTRIFYETYAPKGLEFFNLETLFGRVLVSGEPLIANDPVHDPRRGGLPPGHPPMRSFLGLPLVQGGAMVGLAGIANRSGGYNEALCRELAPLVSTCANLITAHRTEGARKQVEEALRRSEAHCRALFEEAPIAFWEGDLSAVMERVLALRSTGAVDLAAHFARHPDEARECFSQVRSRAVNHAAVALFRATSAGQLLDRLGELLPAELQRKACDGLVALAEGQRKFEVRGRFLALDGMELQLSSRLSVLAGHEKGYDQILISFEDHTDLLQAQDLVGAVLSTVDEGFIVIDPDLRISAANRAFLEGIGLSEGEVLGARCHEITHQTARPCYEDGEDCPVRRAIDTGMTQKATHTHRDALGRESLVELKAYPMRDVFGKVVSVVETFVDVTEKKMLEGEMLKTQKLESIGVLAGGLAHDFNNLLMGVFGYISLAKIGADPAVGGYLEEADKALERARSLTLQLLTFSKGGKPVRRPLEIAPLLRNAVQFTLSGTNIVPHLDLAEHLPTVEADEGQLHQVLQNVILNAVDAMPGGGRLDVEAHVVRLGEGEKHGLIPGDYVRIRVVDTGRGIPQEYLPRIFDPYFTTKPAGKGLGLATSYSIVKNHDGVIEVEPAAGKGAVLAMYFPAAAGFTTLPPAAAGELQTGRGRILLMDDEEIVRDVGGEMLRALGYDADTVSCGEEALAHFQASREAARPYRAVILDLTVRGGMGGCEALEKLLALDPDVRAIVSSGYAEGDIISNFARHGFCAALPKPFRIQQLGNLLFALQRNRAAETG